jgi:hydrogenase maturation protease
MDRLVVCLDQASYSIMQVISYPLRQIQGENPLVDKRSLIIGYGNVYCHDDGVALYIINALRKHSGLRELQPDEDGLDELGHVLDTVLLHQLLPEVMPDLTHYQHVVFVDAHKGIIPDDVRVVKVQEEFGFHAVTHHMSPGMLLATIRQTHHSVPEAHLVSVKGEDFDFGLGLTEPCRLRAEVAVQRIVELVNPQNEK